MFPTLTKKSNLVIGGTAIIAVVIFVAFVMNGKTVPESSNGTDGVAVTTPEAKSFWGSLFSKETPVVIPVKEVVKEVEEPVVLGTGFSADIQAALKPLWITSDITLLQGEGFFSVEDGVLYRTKLKDGVAVERGQKVATGMYEVVAQSEKMVLFTDIVKVPEGMHGPLKNDLWAIDKETGTAKKIYQDVQSANISPKGNMIAVSTASEQVHLINDNGNLLNRVGLYGASAVFSPDGSKLVYRKFIDNPPEGFPSQDFAQSALGVAVYNINTGREVQVSHFVQDYIPLTFSADGRYAYFISERDNTQALYSADLVKGGEPVLLSNPKIPIYLSEDDNLWSSDRRSTFTIGDNGEIFLVKISRDQQPISMSVVGEGLVAFPRWVVRDKLIEFKGKDGEWKTVDVSALVSK